MSATEIHNEVQPKPDREEAPGATPPRIEIPQAPVEASSLGGKASARDEALKRALEPQVREILQTALEENPQLVVNLVYPVLGKAIRRAIATALGSMVSSIEEQASAVFTMRAIRWRWQAFRTGRPYAEIVLANSLVYQVEEILLIHRPTGILLENVSSDSSEMADRDLVSSMLIAIEDFAKDSFAVDSEASLDQFSMGDLHVLVKATPLVVLAAAVRGSVTAEIGASLDEAMEEIHFTHFDRLTKFDGEMSALPPVRDLLARCLLTKTSTGSIA